MYRSEDNRDMCIGQRITEVCVYGITGVCV